MKLLFVLFLFVSSLFATKVELEVLGSGGPELDGRASTSYLLWIDNKAKLLVDMGSGSMLRYEQSGAKLKDLEAIALTHLHIDHCVDLASYVKAGYFTRRTNSLDVLAPFGNKYFPSINEYLQNLFGKNGAYRYMQDVLNNDSDSFQLVPIEIKENKIFKKDYPSFSLTITSVHHGIVPTLAIRIDVEDKSIIISGDTNNQNNSLQTISKDADLFVAHHAISSHANNFSKTLHVEPKEIAIVANQSKVKKILLTHRMNRTIAYEKESLQIIKNIFNNQVIFAEDRMKIEIK